MTIGRRQALTVLATGGVGATLETLLVPQESRAAEMRLAGAKEFTTVCNFCSCGCAMVGHVIEGKLVNLEGDPDGVVNEGSLCAKGAAAFATHDSKQRLTTPKYRAPGSDHWVEISWDEALDKLARNIKDSRDRTFVGTDAAGNLVNRTEGIAFAGGAAFSSEEGYLATKLMRGFGFVFLEQQARV